jgi:glycosidase
MDALPQNPLLYQINTRVLMRAAGAVLGRPAGFDDIPDEALHALRALGVDWVWFLGVWRTDAAGRAISRSNPAWQPQFHAALPDLTEADITGSPFAIAGYQAEPAFGGDGALARLRARANAAGLLLMLDFVPNHMAPDHPWATDRPTLFVRGTEADLAAQPENWIRLPSGIFAHGRDPYFPGWCDTIQLDYANPDTQSAMRDTLLSVADRCDGVRCDVAMLLLPDVFARTWSAELAGRTVPDFWPDAIAAIRRAHPDFHLMAEVYWGLEHRLLDAGFDTAYDKSLYDALLAGDAGTVRHLLSADPAWQSRMARFLENHDEARAAAAFDWPKHRAAALLAFASPGLRFLHQGQLEGLHVHIPIHLDRGPDEPVDEATLSFYRTLLAVLDQPALRQGRYEPLAPQPAWNGNPSHDRFVAALWHDDIGPKYLVVANYGPDQAQCRLHLQLGSGTVTLSDALSPEHYQRDAGEIARDGLYLDLPGWGHNLFALA